MTDCSQHTKWALNVTIKFFFSPTVGCRREIRISTPSLFYEGCQYGVTPKCEMCRHWLALCQLQACTPLTSWYWRVSWSSKVSNWRCFQESLWAPSRPQQSSPSVDEMARGEWGCSNSGSPDQVLGESIQHSSYQQHQKWATEESTVYLIVKQPI